MPTFSNQCSSNGRKIKIVNEVTVDGCSTGLDDGDAQVQLDSNDLKEIAELSDTKRSAYFVDLVDKLAERAGINAKKAHVKEQAASIANDLNPKKLFEIFGLRIDIYITIYVDRESGRIVGWRIDFVIYRP